MGLDHLRDYQLILEKLAQLFYDRDLYMKLYDQLVDLSKINRNK